MFDRLVVWDGNSLIKVGYFAPQVIPSGIVNRGIQRTGIKRKTPRGDGNFSLRFNKENLLNKKKDPERGRKQ